MLPLLLTLLLAQTTDFQADGLKALEARQFDNAIALFSKAVAADPKDYGAHFYLAMAYSMQGKDADAIPEYKTVLQLQPGLYEAEMNLGVSLLQTKDAAGAIEHLTAAAKQKPMEFRPQFYLGEALFASKQYPEAEAAYTAALAINASSAPAELGLGKAMSRGQHLDQAEAHYRKAVALDPSYKDALLDLAQMDENAHQHQQAIAIYKDFPDNPAVLERMGALLLADGHSAEAIAPLEASVAKAPSPANKLQLAQAYMREKQLDKAEPLAAQALAANPQDFDLRMFDARLLRDQRKFPEAAAQFLAAAQSKPDSAAAWNELAGVDLAAEKYPEALAAFDRVKALGAETVANYFFRALALDHLNQAKDALENYNKFLAGSNGQYPNQEFQARGRVKALELELHKR